MSDKLVVYYSQSGNTKKGAMMISELTGADILALVPVTKYPKDLWETVDIFKKELEEGTLCDLEDYDVDLSKYHTIFIGTPNWGDTVATPLRTFFDKESMSDKTIIPFVTHGGGGVGNCAKDIVALSGSTQSKNALVYKNANIQEETIKSWIGEL